MDNTTAAQCARSITANPTLDNVIYWERQAAMVMNGDEYNSSLQLVFKDTSVVYIDTPRTAPKVKRAEYDDGSIEPALLQRSLEMFDKLFHAL